MLVCHPRLVQTGLGPARLCDGVLVRDRLLGLHAAAGLAPLLADRADAAGAGGLPGLPADAAGRCADAGGQEAAVAPWRWRGSCRRRGLAAYGDDGDDLLLALARQIVSGEAAADAEPVGSGRSLRRRRPRPTPRQLLVDDGWQPVVEPEPAVPSKSRATGVSGTGHHPTGHETKAVNGQGRHDDAPAPPQELISWADFLAQVPAPAPAQAPQAPTGCLAAL